MRPITRNQIHRVAWALLLGIVALAAPMRTGPAESAGAAPALRTPWGHPDLEGRWSSATLTPLERPSELGAKEFFTEAEAQAYAATALERLLAEINQTQEEALAGEFSDGLWGEARTIVPTRRTSLITGPTGRVPALTPEGQRRADARSALRGRADAPEERPLWERCLWFPVEGPPMLPGITYNSNYEIVQTPTHVAIHVEMGDGVRIIPLDGRPSLPERIGLWFGDSRGRWDGDTLVVETTRFNDRRDMRGASSQLHLVERFHRTAPDRLMYTFTASDPTMWREPWSAEIPMQPLTGRLFEYACHEGNRSLANILSAARAAEAASGPPRHD